MILRMLTAAEMINEFKEYPGLCTVKHLKAKLYADYTLQIKFRELRFDLRNSETRRALPYMGFIGMCCGIE